MDIRRSWKTTGVLVADTKALFGAASSSEIQAREKRAAPELLGLVENMGRQKTEMRWCDSLLSSREAECARSRVEVSAGWPTVELSARRSKCRRRTAHGMNCLEMLGCDPRVKKSGKTVMQVHNRACAVWPFCIYQESLSPQSYTCISVGYLCCEMQTTRSLLFGVITSPSTWVSFQNGSTPRGVFVFCVFARVRLRGLVAVWVCVCLFACLCV